MCLHASDVGLFSFMSKKLYTWWVCPVRRWHKFIVASLSHFVCRSLLTLSSSTNFLQSLKVMFAFRTVFFYLCCPYVFSHSPLIPTWPETIRNSVVFFLRASFQTFSAISHVVFSLLIKTSCNGMLALIHGYHLALSSIHSVQLVPVIYSVLNSQMGYEMPGIGDLWNKFDHMGFCTVHWHRMTSVVHLHWTVCHYSAP